MKRTGFLLISAFSWVALGTALGAEGNEATLTLLQAEKQAMSTSNQIKASEADEEAASQQAGAQFALALPKLSAQMSYTYLGTIPTIPPSPPFPNGLQLGTNNNYVIGPQISYALWDTFSAINAYRSSNKTAQARIQDRLNTQYQILLSVRTSYVSARLAMDELHATADTLELSRAQRQDVANRFKAGAAARLDMVTADRSVITYELQYRQQQIAVDTAVKDLMAILGVDIHSEQTMPKLESLKDLLASQGAMSVSPPDSSQPVIKSLALTSEASDLQSASTRGKLLPTLNVSFATTLNYPNGPIVEQYTQYTLTAAVTMPLWLGDPNWHLASQQAQQSEAARYREEQQKINIDRDFTKARETLGRLQDQKKLAAEDIVASEEAARLYYSSYKAGKVNLIDVQNANVQALQSKVNAARIDAQILSQFFTLKELSAKELGNE